MKKVTSLFLILIIVFSFAACQVTPEEPIVVKKDIERMVEQAQNEKAGSRLSDFTLPDGNYTFTSTGINEKLIIQADAPITLPGAGRFPIVRVTAADFTQEQVDSLLTAFFGNQTLYEVHFGAETKDEIMQKILLYKQWKTWEEYASAGNQRLLDEQIAMLETAYINAPETSGEDVAVSDGKLKLKEISDPSTGKHTAYYYGIAVTTNYEDPWKAASFNVENNSDMKEAIWQAGTAKGSSWHSGEGIISGEGTPLSYSASLSYSNPGDAYGSSFDQPTPVSEKTVIEMPEVLAKLKTTPAQAKKLIEQTLAAAGIDNMAVAAMFLINDGSLGEKPTPAKHYAYKVYLCRMVNGIPVSYISGITGMSAFNEAIQNNKPDAMADAFSASYLWYYETINVMVDDTGILSFDWKSPLNIGGTLVEDAVLLPFANIAAMFEKRMEIQYGPQAKDEFLTCVTITVEHVALEYQRIIEQNSNQNGLLVPVWNFYGKCVTTDKNDEEQAIYSGDDTYPFPLASINAIDGSIIDVSKGY